MAPTCVSRIVHSADGTPIYAEAAGDHSNTHVVFVHGMSLSGAVFDGLFEDERLLSKFYMVRFDTRGHGRSGMPDDAESYSSKRYADDFQAVANEFQLHQAVFVGWSYGCTLLADICTHLRPLPISRAVYLAGLPYTGPLLSSVITPSLTTYFSDLATLTDTTLYARARLRFVHDMFRHPTTVPFPITASWLGQVLMQHPAVFSLCVSRVQDPEGLFDAGKKGLPMLVVAGTEDKIVNGAVAASALRPYFTDLELREIDGGSHALFYDNREEVVSVLLEFITRDTGRVELACADGENPPCPMSSKPIAA